MKDTITMSLEDAKLVVSLADLSLSANPDMSADKVLSGDDLSHASGGTIVLLGRALEALAKLRSQVAEKSRPLPDRRHDRIIDWAKKFSAPNEPKPFVKDLVLYYQVGRNATHSFYAGIDLCSGRLYRASGDTELGDEWYVSEKESLESFVNDYMGHY